MTSTSTNVFPINALSFTVDRSITNVDDVINHLSHFETVVKTYAGGFKDGEADVVYGVTHDANDLSKQKFSIGPLEISIALDVKSGNLALQVFLVVPVIGTVLVGSASGSLTDGVAIKVGFGSILGGSVGIKLDGANYVLFYEFHAFGKTYKGQIKLPF